MHESGPIENLGGRPGDPVSASITNLDSAKFISLTEAASSQGGSNAISEAQTVSEMQSKDIFIASPLLGLFMAGGLRGSEHAIV